MGWSDITDDQADAVVQRALAAGIRRFDTADAYGIGLSEQRLGAALGDTPRDQLRITSKVGYLQPPDGSSPLRRDNLLSALEKTLHRLRTDYVDVYFLHHSSATPAELDEFASVAQQLRDEGTIRAMGARGPHRFAPERSTATARVDKTDQFRTMFTLIRPEVVSLRANLLSPLDTGAGSVIAWLQAQGTDVQIYKPLAQGLLSERFSQGFPPFGSGDHRSKKGWFVPAAHQPLLELLAAMKTIVPGYSAVEIALAWVDHLAPDATVLVGSTDPEHVSELAEARQVTLSEEQITRLQRIARHYRDQVPAYLD